MFTSVCLSVKLDNSESYERILVKFWEGGRGRNNVLDFDGSPDRDGEPGIF